MFFDYLSAVCTIFPHRPVIKHFFSFCLKHASILSASASSDFLRLYHGIVEMLETRLALFGRLGAHQVLSQLQGAEFLWEFRSALGGSLSTLPGWRLADTTWGQSAMAKTRRWKSQGIFWNLIWTLYFYYAERCHILWYMQRMGRNRGWCLGMWRMSWEMVWQLCTSWT